MDRALLRVGLMARGGEELQAAGFPAVAIPSRDTEVAAHFAGIVRRVGVEEGGKVGEGQPLVELDSDLQRAEVQLCELRVRSMAAKLDVAEAALKLAKTEYDRARALHKAAAAPAGELEAAEHKLRVAEAELADARGEVEAARTEGAQARLVLDRMTIRAPHAGVVLRCLKAPGEFAAGGEPVVRLVDPRVRHVVAYVPARQAAGLRPGAAALFRLASQPQRSFACAVSMIDPVADPATGECRVKLALDDPKGELMAGSRGAVQFRPAPPRREDE